MRKLTLFSVTAYSALVGSFTTLGFPVPQARGAVLATLSAEPAALPDDPEAEPVRSTTIDLQAITDEISQIGFDEPIISLDERSRLQALYQYVDPTVQVPPALLAKALGYYHANLEKIKNKNYLTIADFSQHSSKSRFYLVNMNTGSVWALHVAHGKGSDPTNSGFATRFSNASGTEETSLGYYLTAETYNGDHGFSLRVDGLSATNSNVRARGIVVHGASYVSDSNIQAGRSWGCFAVPLDDRNSVVDDIKGGSIIFAAGPSGLE